jgi:hypothetical protein
MVLYITMNGNSRTCGPLITFALMYRRASGTFYEGITFRLRANPVNGKVELNEPAETPSAIQAY